MGVHEENAWVVDLTPFGNTRDSISDPAFAVSATAIPATAVIAVTPPRALLVSACKLLGESVKNVGKQIAGKVEREQPGESIITEWFTSLGYNGQIGYVTLKQFLQDRDTSDLKIERAPADQADGIRICEKARRHVGRGVKYDVLRRNCEHFANWCVAEDPHDTVTSKQSEKLVKGANTGGCSILGALGPGVWMAGDFALVASLLSEVGGCAGLVALTSGAAIVGFGSVAAISALAAGDIGRFFAKKVRIDADATANYFPESCEPPLELLTSRRIYEQTLD